MNQFDPNLVRKVLSYLNNKKAKGREGGKEEGGENRGRRKGAPAQRVTVKLASYDSRAARRGRGTSDGGVGLSEVHLLKPASISAVRDVRSHGAACCGLLGLRCMHICRERGA